MGMSSEGILFWGVWFENGELEAAGIEDLGDKAYELNKKLRNEAAPQPAKGEPPHEYKGPAWDEWRARVKECEARSCDVRSAGHCNNSYATYVYVVASRLRAEWSQMLAVESLQVPPEWEPRLIGFCAALNLPHKQAQWWLTSSYG